MTDEPTPVRMTPLDLQIAGDLLDHCLAGDAVGVAEANDPRVVATLLYLCTAFIRMVAAQSEQIHGEPRDAALILRQFIDAMAAQLPT